MLLNGPLVPINSTDFRGMGGGRSSNPNACGYKIGHLELQRLRESAKTRLGSRFDRRAFHDEVLGYGSPPLEVLARAVDAWVERQKASARQTMRQS
jgi:hypothetical protein